MFKLVQNLVNYFLALGPTYFTCSMGGLSVLLMIKDDGLV